MKIKYEFINGDEAIVEVDEEIGNIIRASRNKEAAYDKKCQRWCLSLSDVNDKSNWLASMEYNPDYLLDRFIEEIEAEKTREEKRQKLREAMRKLTFKQQEVLRAVLYGGKSLAEFAVEKGIDKSTASKRYKAAVKKIKKFF